MSHYTKMSISAQQEYEAELVAALKKHFGEDVETHGDTKVPLMTWDRRDSGLKANIVVRKKTLAQKKGYEVLSNDLGYERNKEGGYNVHADEAGFDTLSQNAVASYYAQELTEKRLKSQGYSVAARKTLEDGRVQVQFSRTR